MANHFQKNALNQQFLIFFCLRTSIQKKINSSTPYWPLVSCFFENLKVGVPLEVFHVPQVGNRWIKSFEGEDLTYLLMTSHDTVNDRVADSCWHINNH